MKKKIVALTLVIAMLAICFGATMAYFMDTDEATNVMTMGNVKIQQLEYERVVVDGVKTNDLQLFTNNQKIFPAVYDLTDADGKNIDPARASLTVNGCTISIRNFPNYVDKIVTVGNIGNSDAYVRVIVAVPVNPNEDDADGNVSENWLHANWISDKDTTKNNGWYFGTSANKEEYPDSYQDHYIVRNVEIDGKLYDLTVATNVNPLAPMQETGPCMAGFYLDNDLNYDDNGWYMPYDDDDGKFYIVEGNGAITADMCIMVATQAVQVQGFADAWQAFDASFGEITAVNHPWAE